MFPQKRLAKRSGARRASRRLGGVHALPAKSTTFRTSRNVGAEEARGCHGELLLVAPCLSDQVSPKSAHGDPTAKPACAVERTANM